MVRNIIEIYIHPEINIHSFVYQIKIQNQHSLVLKMVRIVFLHMIMEKMKRILPFQIKKWLVPFTIKTWIQNDVSIW